jgi:hypothetical protein
LDFARRLLQGQRPHSGSLESWSEPRVGCCCRKCEVSGNNPYHWRPHQSAGSE